MRQAFSVLAADGLISTRKGARRMVLPQPRLQGFNELRSFSQWANVIGEAPGGHVVELVRREATVAEAEQLGTEQVYHLTRVRLLSGRPVMIERTAYPERIGALVASMDVERESITDRLRELGVLFANAAHTLSAVSASAEDARLLSIRARTPLLRELRLSTDPDGVRAGVVRGPLPRRGSRLHRAQLRPQQHPDPRTPMTQTATATATMTQPAIWLRDNCPCADCRDPRNGQKLFGITDLTPTSPSPTSPGRQ